jgi:hypothetical protein
MVTTLFLLVALVLLTIGFPLVRRGSPYTRRGGDTYTKRRMRRMLGWMMWTTAAVLLFLALMNTIYSAGPSVDSVAQAGPSRNNPPIVVPAASTQMIPDLIQVPSTRLSSRFDAPTTNQPGVQPAPLDLSVQDHNDSIAPSLVKPLPSEAGGQTPSDASPGFDLGKPAAPPLPQEAPGPAPPSPSIQPPRIVPAALDPARQKQFEAAAAAADAEVKKDPTNVIALIRRGNAHTYLRKWDLAKKDYGRALQIDSRNAPARFNLAELSFMQGQFDQARPGFFALEGEIEFGDIARYSVFLCDLFGGHADAAARELDAFNQAGSDASYYFANVAWALYHNKNADAQSWWQSANHIFSPAKVNLYATPLTDLGYVLGPVSPN